MHIFFIGATGYIGSHAVKRLIAAGYHVTGMARNERGRAKLEAIGASVFLGDAEDLQALNREAALADVTIFSPQLPSQDQEYATVASLLQGYSGTGKTFIFTSGTGVLGQRTDGAWSEDSFAEDDPFVTSKYVTRRRETELLVQAAAQQNVRAMVIRPPMIWGSGYYGLVDRILHSIERTGSACYIGAGMNLYTNVHVDDLAELFHLVVEKGISGALYHGVSGELNNRTVAELVARQQGVSARSVTFAEAIEIWDKVAVLIVLGVSSRSRSPRARSELGWVPTRLDLYDQILAGALNTRERS
jgi:nucleoside-diphosphate-sugar epimerase